MVIRVAEGDDGTHRLDQLHEILRSYPGNCELQLVLCLQDGRRVACKCGGFTLGVNDQMRDRVEQLLGPGNIRLITASPSSPRRPNYQRSRHTAAT